MNDSTQPAPPYHTPARLARTALLTAMEEAKEMLPQVVRARHYVATKQSPAAWRSVESWYLSQAERDPQIVDTLTDLALMSEALACLIGILTERTTTGTFKLAKMKRVEM